MLERIGIILAIVKMRKSHCAVLSAFVLYIHTRMHYIRSTAILSTAWYGVRPEKKPPMECLT
jgi:hypothetical protein